MQDDTTNLLCEECIVAANFEQTTHEVFKL